MLAIAAVGAAYYGFSQAVIARQQQILAQQRQAEAEAAKATAQQRQAEAEDAKAQAETRKTAQRSAVLAAGTATGLANEGSTDAALLLLLDSARWFDDTNVPDEVRIAFTNAMQKTERATVSLTAPNVRTFPLRSALVLVDDATGEINAIKDKATPTVFKQTGADKSQVELIMDDEAEHGFFLLRESGTIEALDLDTMNSRPLGAFAPPNMGSPPKASSAFGNADAGVIIRVFQSAPSNREVMQLYDLSGGKAFESVEDHYFDKYNQCRKIVGRSFFSGSDRQRFETIRARRRR